MLDYVEHHNGVERRATANVFRCKCSMLDFETTRTTEVHGALTHFDPLHFEIRVRFGQKETVRTSEFEQSATAAASLTEILNGGPEFAA